MEYKQCKDCNQTFPVTRDYFGQYKNKRSDGTVKIGFRNSCRSCMAANTRKYDVENPQNAMKRAQRRSKLEKNATGQYTEEDIKHLRNNLNDCCRFCGAQLNKAGHIEHLTPLARGGSHNKNNITLSCYKCNLEKTSKTLDEYLEWRKERNLHIRTISYKESPDKPTIARGRKSY